MSCARANVTRLISRHVVTGEDRVQVTQHRCRTAPLQGAAGDLGSESEVVGEVLPTCPKRTVGSGSNTDPSERAAKANFRVVQWSSLSSFRSLDRRIRQNVTHR
jgi:hypothetical protein